MRSVAGSRLTAATAAVVLAAACTSASPVTSARATRPAVPLASREAVTSPAVRPAERVAAPAGAARPAQPVIAPTFRTALVADYCVDRDVAAPGAADRALTLLDRTYMLPTDYVPADLVSATAAGFDGPSGGRLVSGMIVDDLAAMRAAWTAADLVITIDSAYRSASSQASTFAAWKAQLGAAAAAQRTARPGHSEHQLGTALDLTSPGWRGRFGDWATESAEGAWMAAHGWEFGFVMSYGPGEAVETCYGYEPWHYRWIGREVAAEHRASGLSLRRFLERFVSG